MAFNPDPSIIAEMSRVCRLIRNFAGGMPEGALWKLVPPAVWQTTAVFSWLSTLSGKEQITVNQNQEKTADQNQQKREFFFMTISLPKIYMPVLLSGKSSQSSAKIVILGSSDKCVVKQQINVK